MVKNTKTSRRPLLYINQPEFENGFVPMQQEFVVSKKANKVENSKEVKVKDPERFETKEVSKEEKEVSTLKQPKRKRVSEMNIEEKIQFFLKLPNNMPRTMCEIVTKEKKYTGIILSFSHEDGLVSLRTINSPESLTIPLEDIHSIHAIGF
ncbi:hypothetical protein IM538_05565 [Cytobacillus suaedae]|nr:hypothetical protein IM538_05565 [Cytobacillus suaedae]